MNYQRLYDYMAPFYAPAMHLLPMWKRYVQQALPCLPPSGTILEVGPGPGMLLAQIAQVRSRPIGIDLSFQMLRRAQHRLRRNKLPAHFTQANVMRLPFIDGTFDGIVLTFVFSAIPDGAAAMRELQRVLRPDGVLALIDACVPGDHNFAARGLGRLWTLFGDFLRDEAALMQASGLDVIERREFGAFHSIRLTVGRQGLNKVP
jgi:ubiquinone/menaquinone biosynthesis C-methylase UbiE